MARIENPDYTKITLARESLQHFVELTSNLKLHRWQLDLCKILERFRHESGLRLLIHGPPQHGKSIILTKRLPAWLLGHFPDRREVVACFNVDHATGLVSTCRDVMRTPEYRMVFPDSDCEIDEPSSQKEFFTRLRASRMDSQHSLRAISLNTGFTGSGADDLFMDDPYESPEHARSEVTNERTKRFWPEGAKPRVSESCNVAMMFHRYHPGDAAGALLETGKWEEFRFPAIADEDDGTDPTRMWRGFGEPLSPTIKSLPTLREIEESDPEVFWGQFQGRPRSPKGALFSEDMFEVVDELPSLGLWIRAWDPASSDSERNDATASAKVGVDVDGSICIADVTRWKRQWPQTRDGEWEGGRPYEKGARCTQKGLIQITKDDFAALEREAEAKRMDRATYLVAFAKKGLGLPMVQSLQDNREFLRIPLYPIDEKGDKKQRASVWAAKGRVRPIRILRREWTDGFLKRTLAFRGDGTTPDDEQDAVSLAMALLYIYHEGKSLEKLERPETGSLAFYRTLGKQRDDWE
jgi:phage terminase large subunit-like protein